MPPMAHVDVREMIESLGLQMGVRYERDALNLLTQSGGGHPFITRQICSRAMEGRLGRGAITVTAEQAQAAIGDYMVNGGYLSELWVERLDATQRDMLRMLAQTPGPVPRARLLPLSERQAVMAALRMLDEWTLVRQKQDDYEISWDIFRRWIRWMILGLEE